MKIFHISPAYFPAVGGAELHIRELSEGLASRGHRVTVLTGNTRNLWDMIKGIGGGLPRVELINGVKVVRFRPDGGLMNRALCRWQHIRGGYRSSRLIFGEDGLELLTEKPSMLQLIPYLFFKQADIVSSINWGLPPAYHTYLARRLKNFIHVGIPLFHTASGWCKRPIYKKMLTKCDAVVVNTSHEGEFVRNLAPATKIVVGGVGIHPGLFEGSNGEEIRFRYQLGRNPVVGFVGRQDSSKGVVKLIQAMKTVWNWNHEVRLVLAGHRPPQHYGMDAVIEELSEFERRRIVRIGNFSEDEKPSIYHAMDVFVLPSTEESFGIAYLEAWICGKAVIGARIGSTMCVIDDGIDGLLVDPKDPEDIGRAIVELLSDKNKREKMGRNGQIKAKEQFTWEKVKDRVERLYVELVAAKS